jgi:prepilin-type N-terminal cleavage/methylation domain-containing protein
MRPAPSKSDRAAGGFSLIELLTVIAIIAVLASLLLTGIASAKRKSRTMTCTGNLHQFSLALNMFMDDSGGQRPSVDDLVSSRYLPSPQSLICPEDKTGNWGQLVQLDGGELVSTGNLIPTTNNYSYLLYPLTWSDAEWKTLVSAGSQAGVAACQLHGLGSQNAPNVQNFSGLLLRAQLDGSVIRRQFFWTPLAAVMPSLGNSSTPADGLGSMTDSLYPFLEIYFDDPANWQNLQ